MKNRVFVVGNGMTKFLKPNPKNPDYPEMGKQATQRALRDAGISYDQIQHVPLKIYCFDTLGLCRICIR